MDNCHLPYIFYISRNTYPCNILGSFCVWHNSLRISEQVSNQSRFSEDASCRTNLNHESDHLYCSFQTDLPIGSTDSLECFSFDTQNSQAIYLFFCCDVYVVQSRDMMLLNSAAGNLDSNTHRAMVSSSYVRYWIFIVGRKRSIRPCYGWPTWHTRDPRRERRTGDYTDILPLHWFSIHLSSLNVSLCVFVIRVR